MIAVGVDTHKERHYAVALDQLGQMLGELIVRGDRRRLRRAAALGRAARRTARARVRDRRRRQLGRRPVPAPAARRALGPRGGAPAPARPTRRQVRPHRRARCRQARARGENISTPRRRGILTAIRALLIARRSAVTERTRVLNQLQALNATAPIVLRERIGEGTGKQLERRILSMRARANADRRRARRIRGHARPGGPLAHPWQPTPSATSTSSPSSSARSIRRCSTSPGSGRSPPRSCWPATPPASRARRLRALQRHRADPGLIRQDRPLPPQPRRRPPSQQRDPHDRDHPRHAPTRDPRLPRPPHQRRQDQARSHALTQAPPLPRALPPAHRDPLDFIEASLTRFGLVFALLDRRYFATVRRERGFGVNSWRTHSRFLVSHTC